ncbi:MAG TPA: NADPH-dependent F420 reductase [Steroidobacteraceae bacterium]|nr:NADPH-dependent F420 reductase [Steroidobacteraceae bacterium]HRX89787.1 NADPH-dependent F420 reductase [Steroidobacteraceae bacterium]
MLQPSKRQVLVVGLLVALFLCTTSAWSAESQKALTDRAPRTIAIITTARWVIALGPRLATLGNHVIFGSRNPDGQNVAQAVELSGPNSSGATRENAVTAADIVILALPWQDVESSVSKLRDQLNGKVLVDMNNPLKVTDDSDVELAVDGSGGELIQQWAPGARVVKALNAIGAHVIAEPAAAGGPVTVPIAGNDAAAKATVAQMIQSLGFDVVDIGSMRHARHLESLAALYWAASLVEPSGERTFEYHLHRSSSPEAKAKFPGGEVRPTTYER